MDKDIIDFQKAFEQLGIVCDPLPKNYNPDSFGKALLCNFREGQEVEYASKTILVPEHPTTK